MNKCFIIKNKPTIQKYVVFLCGAYFRDRDSDKRKILINFINSISKGTVIPIIVDEFLSGENIETDTFSIEQYEELISSVSFANFIFLESFSSASELGLFTHSTSTNKNYVFYPDSSNLILDKVGYFIKYGVLEDAKKVVAEPYLALVERYAHGTDFIDEHYYFAKNVLPNNIAKITKEAIDDITAQELNLKINVNDKAPKKLDFFELYLDKEKSTVLISTRTAFYLLYSLLFFETTIDEIASLDIRKELPLYCDILKTVLSNTIYYNCDITEAHDCSIEVLGFERIEDFVSCALFFIKYMSRKMILNKSINKFLLIKPKDVLSEIDFKTKEKGIFYIPQNVSNIKKMECIKRFTLYKKHKARNIIAYDDVNGGKLRDVHELMSNELHKACADYSLCSEQSFAYKKGISTLDCVNKHIKSKHFLKMDIHHFFETMSFESFVSTLFKRFENNKFYLLMSSEEKIKFQKRFCKYISLAAINKRFPIGFVTSPVISDIYLSEFDSQILKVCEEMKIVYTRYADDLLFSSLDAFDFDKVEKTIKEKLKNFGLEINEKKTLTKSFYKDGDSINYIGLNLVFNKNKTAISIGKTYIKRLAILKVYGHKTDYNDKKIKGLESYLKFNDKDGYQKYLELIKIYTYKNHFD